MIAAALVSLALSASAFARSGPLGPENNYIAPVGVQIGTISQTINCTASLKGLPVISNAQFSLVLGGSLSTSVSAGGSFYLVGRAIVTGSQQFTSQLVRLGTTSFSGKLTSTVFELPGSSAGAIDIAKTQSISFPSQTVSSGKPVVLNIPAKTSAPLRIGPVSPASGSAQVLVAIGAAALNVSAVIAGQTLPVQIACKANNPLNYLAFVTVGGSVSTPTLGDYPPVTAIPAGSVIGSTGLNYNCAIGGISGTVSIPTSLTTFGSKLLVSKGATFQYLNSHGTINITQAVVAKIKASITTGTASKFSITVSQIKASGTNISPTSVNLLGSSVTSDTVSLSSTTGTYSVSIPGSNGVLPPVSFKAGTSTGTAFIYLGDATVSINVYDSAGKVLKTLSASCKAPTTPKAPLLPLNVV